MPPELFHNSNVGVIACVVVFKAKEQHPANYKTYFGYWKDDGFIKRKSGRDDYQNKWNGIKKRWLENYRNKEEMKGFSVKRHVAANDEWCVEAYMETDYTSISPDDFAQAIKNFIAFEIVNENNLKKTEQNEDF